jgi:hypothetical protein
MLRPSQSKSMLVVTLDGFGISRGVTRLEPTEILCPFQQAHLTLTAYRLRLQRCLVSLLIGFSLALALSFATVAIVMAG